MKTIPELLAAVREEVIELSFKKDPEGFPYYDHTEVMLGADFVLGRLTPVIEECVKAISKYRSDWHSEIHNELQDWLAEIRELLEGRAK